MAGAALENVRRVTLADIARSARVSTATVDRVMNGRAGVKDRTRGRVVAKALELGYLAREEADQLTRAAALEGMPPAAEEGAALKAVALDFVLPGGRNRFISLLTEHLARLAGAGPARTVRVHAVKGFDADDLARKLLELRSRSDGVGVVGIDHPTVREAMRELVRARTPVLTLVSDISCAGTVGYVGIDNRSAGRLAGYLLGRFVPRAGGPVALFAGALAYRAHEGLDGAERLLGRVLIDGRVHDPGQEQPPGVLGEIVAVPSARRPGPKGGRPPWSCATSATSARSAW